MSGSEAIAGGPTEAVPEEGRRPRATCGCQAALCACGTIGGAIRRICPTPGEIKKSTERLRGSIRAQPLTAVLVALAVGVLVGRHAGSRERTTGARR